MRTVVYDRHGDPSQVLRLDSSAQPPVPAAEEVLVRVLVRPVHPGDLVNIVGSDGDELPQPRSPGLEGMGVVESIGKAVSEVDAGTRVAFFGVWGAWSEYVIARFVVPLPNDVSDETGSQLLLNPLTMLELLRAVEEAWAGRPQPLLQTAAGSSVGKLITAVAEARRYPLVNLVRSVEGADALARRFPSIPTIATSDADWPARVRSALGGAASVILDAVGGEFAGDLVEVLGEGGTLVEYGALGGPVIPLQSRWLVRRDLRLRGVSVGRWRFRTSQQQKDDVAFTIELARGEPDLFEVAGSYELEEFKRAIEDAGRTGKVGTVLLTSRAGINESPRVNQ
jgi:NADPH:quinone reductase-like Zn-dependent oxidoreductase